MGSYLPTFKLYGGLILSEINKTNNNSEKVSFARVINLQRKVKMMRFYNCE